MTKPCSSTSYITELSLLLSIVLLENSVVLLCDHFLPYSLTLLITLASVTCYFLAFSYYLNLNQSNFYVQYWNPFFLTCAHLASFGDTANWTLHRGRVTLLIGFLILLSYELYVLIRRAPPGQGESNDVVVPFPIECSFVLMGNGIAMMGRWVLPDHETLGWTLFGGGMLFFCSSLLFYVYCVRSKSHNKQLHVE